MQGMSWVLLVYHVPTEPASKRVGVWRDLKRSGALYLQQCVCIFPNRAELVDEIGRIAAKIVAMEGEYHLFDIPHIPPADEAKIVAAFRTSRNKEYAEIVEECETKFVKEIEFEHFRQNYTFEEAEEIGQDLEKIRRWFARIVERDWFGADRRGDVEVWIEKCQELLNAFEQTVYQRSSDDSSTNVDIGISPVGLVRGLPPVPASDGAAGRQNEQEKETGS